MLMHRNKPADQCVFTVNNNNERKTKKINLSGVEIKELVGEVEVRKHRLLILLFKYSSSRACESLMQHYTRVSLQDFYVYSNQTNFTACHKDHVSQWLSS